jgi:hypothetical protein
MASRQTACANLTKRRLYPYELFLLTVNQLRIMRNIFYAQYGYIFRTRDLEKAFTVDEAMIEYEPDPGFKESLLTDTDRANIQTIRHLEALPARDPAQNNDS